MLMARSLSAPRSLRAPSTRSADASAGADNTVTRVSTPRVESSKIEAVGSIKSEPAKAPEPEKTEALELRKSTN
jgi:hypothetical protein